MSHSEKTIALRHFLQFKDFDRAEHEYLLARAADIKAKSGSCSASLLGATISAVEGATQKSLKRIGLFNESMAESYKAKFTAIYNAFLLEKTSH